MPPLKKSKTTGEINAAKLERRNLLDQQKRIKPGECQKYIRILIGIEVFKEIGAIEKEQQFHNKLKDAGVKSESSYLYSNCIFWERSEQQTFHQSESNINLSEKYNKEEQILIIVGANMFISSLCFVTNSIVQIREKWVVCPKITVIIYGIEQLLGKATSMDIEMKTTELQILKNVNVRRLEKFDDFQSMVLQYTKAVAEIPFKKQESNKFSESGANAFLLNDNKDCVKVESNNAGLSRLWQQHLTRLPLVTLEVAEAIMLEFPFPVKLLDFKRSQSEKEFINFIADIKVRRSGGGGAVLQNARRIGPELAKKIHTLFSTVDPQEFL